MFKHKNVLKWTLGLAAAAFLTAAWASHSWNNYHWARTTASFTLKTVDSVTADWDQQLNDSLNAWAVSNVLEFNVVAQDDSDRTRKRCPMVQGQMRVCNAAYGQNGWLGLASIGLDSNGHIDQGTAKMNDSYDWYWTPEEKNHVMCQEIGHVFGLGHTSEDGSSQNTCMDYSTSSSSQWPNSHDYQQISEIYNHLDSYNSYDGDGGDGGDGGSGCNAPPGKGCNKSGANVGANYNVPMGILVRKSKHEEIYVASRADGGYWIHHVRLAEPADSHDHEH